MSCWSFPAWIQAGIIYSLAIDDRTSNFVIPRVGVNSINWNPIRANLSPLRELTKTSQQTEDELNSRLNQLKDDLHDADRRADNSERQVWKYQYRHWASIFSFQPTVHLLFVTQLLHEGCGSWLELLVATIETVFTWPWSRNMIHNTLMFNLLFIGLQYTWLIFKVFLLLLSSSSTLEPAATFIYLFPSNLMFCINSIAFGQKGGLTASILWKLILFSSLCFNLGEAGKMMK